MPRLAKPVTDTMCQLLKPGKTLACGDGLHLSASRGGRRSWFVRYRTVDGTRGKVLVGHYPTMSLAEARLRASGVHAAARSGDEIVGVRLAARRARNSRSEEVQRIEREKAEAIANSFAVQAQAWLEHKRQSWDSATAQRAEDAVNQYLCPAIGHQDMRTLRSKDVVEPLLAIHSRVPSTALKCRQYLQGVVSYCIMRGVRPDDALLNLKGIFPTNKKPKHHPAITAPVGLGALWLAIRGYTGSHTVRAALQFSGWTALRPGALVETRWDEVDEDQAMLVIPGSRMKMGNDHVVPLPRQAMAVLEELRQYRDESGYLFPAVARQGRAHIHRDSLSKALRDELGFRGQHVTHGFRASFRTLARERLRGDIDVLERQLAHVTGDKTKQAYDCTAFLEQRREIAQQWADWLDEQATIAEAGNVIPLREAV